jgi:addiction module HigA family antidote
MDRFDAKRRCKFRHPGEVLASFTEPYGISQNLLARCMGVSPRRINEIVQGKRSITADTAIGLAEVFGGDPLYWMKLQARYDIAVRELERQGRPTPAIRMTRVGPWDEGLADEQEYRAALRRGRKLRSEVGR